MSAELFFKQSPDMSCKPDYGQAVLDSIRLDSESSAPKSLFIEKTPIDSIEQTIKEKGLFSVYEAIKNKKLRAFFALNNHQNGLYQFLADIKAAITGSVSNNETLSNEKKSEIYLNLFEVCTDSLKIEIDSIEGSETKYRYTATTRTSQKNDLCAVSCSVEIDETTQKIMIKDKNIILSQEAAGYLETSKILYEYSDESSYPLGAEKSNFEALWEKEKKIFLKNLEDYISKEKREDYVIIMNKLKKEAEGYMNKTMSSLNPIAENIQIDEIKKNNKEFIYKIKLKLKQLYSSKENKQKIDKDFDLCLARLQFKSTQPFMNKWIDNIGKNEGEFYADPKEKTGKKENEIFLAEISKSQLMQKTNDFYEKIEADLSNDLKENKKLEKTFKAFSDDFNATVENSGLNILKNEESKLKTLLDDVSRSLSEHGLSDVASVVDSISLFIFGPTKYEIAKKGCEMIKTLSEDLKEELKDLKDLPMVRPAVM